VIYRSRWTGWSRWTYGGVHARRWGCVAGWTSRRCSRPWSSARHSRPSPGTSCRVPPSRPAGGTGHGRRVTRMVADQPVMTPTGAAGRRTGQPRLLTGGDHLVDVLVSGRVSSAKRRSESAWTSTPGLVPGPSVTAGRGPAGEPGGGSCAARRRGRWIGARHRLAHVPARRRPCPWSRDQHRWPVVVKVGVTGRHRPGGALTVYAQHPVGARNSVVGAELRVRRGSHRAAMIGA
jgi:hypothetical protein